MKSRFLLFHKQPLCGFRSCVRGRKQEICMTAFASNKGREMGVRRGKEACPSCLRRICTVHYHQMYKMNKNIRQHKPAKNEENGIAPLLFCSLSIPLSLCTCTLHEVHYLVLVTLTLCTYTSASNRLIVIFEWEFCSQIFTIWRVFYSWDYDTTNPNLVRNWQLLH